MGTLDDLLIKAKDLANAAGNKAQDLANAAGNMAQEVAELARLRLQAGQLRSELDSNYLKLGEIIYELQKAGAENQDLIDMCIAEIESQNEDLEELNGKINDLKNEKKCPECMSSNSKEAMYCSRCGSPLHTAPDVVVYEDEEEQPTVVAELPSEIQE